VFFGNALIIMYLNFVIMSFIEEALETILLFAWVIFVAMFLTRRLYNYMTSCGVEHYVAVYYNRKVIHILAGGLCAVIVTFAFETPFLPLLMAAVLAVFLYTPHRIGKIMSWFQVEDNMYEVSFAIMWGIILSLGWTISGGNFWFGVLPVLFMAVGDAITGIVRNIIYRRRTKSWKGNLAMALFSIPIGSTLGVAGILAGVAASIVEHFEFKPIDDNITVPLVSLIILSVAKFYAPWLLS
jgi:phytol kinase